MILEKKKDTKRFMGEIEARIGMSIDRLMDEGYGCQEGEVGE